MNETIIQLQDSRTDIEHQLKCAKQAIIDKINESSDAESLCATLKIDVYSLIDAEIERRLAAMEFSDLIDLV